MSEGQLISLYTFWKKQFDDQLTCSVCLGQYTNPKTLPCHHSYCLKCIERLEVEDEESYIKCPECRVHHVLPDGGASCLPNDFKINSMIDLKKKFTTTKIGSLGLVCPKHSHPLTVYCETCNQVMCGDCTVSTEHNTHTCRLISECYPKHRSQLEDNLDHVRNKQSEIDTAMTQLDSRDSEALVQGERVKEEINAHAQHLIDNIQQSRSHLTQQVDTIVQSKRQTLATQRQQAQKQHDRLKSCVNMIEQSLKEWNQQKILTQKIIMMHEMKTSTEDVDPAVFKPMEDTNIQYEKEDKEMGSVESIYYGNAILEVPPCMAKQLSKATLTLHSQDGSPFSLPPSLISSTLSSPGKEQLEKCPITQTQPGKYNITFTPTATRNDQLTVQVGGVDVPNIPLTIPVIVTREMRGKPVNTIAGLGSPAGLALCNNGDIVVAERGVDFVSILNKKGERMKEFGRFNFPSGVAVSTDGHILVTDNHRVQKRTTDGILMKSIGSRSSGNGPLQFNTPLGIAVNPNTGQIYVADSENNRIQVFTNDLTFLRTITPSWSFFSLFPQFKRPEDVAIDSQGNLYIADTDSPYIFKYGSNGTLMKRFGSTPDQKTITPCSVAVHDNLVYTICESDCDNIIVFNTDGKFQYKFRGDTAVFKYPWGMAVDSLGNLFISDYDKNKIVVY